eukprot:CAMPEP_0168611708 /NCGR_PEP_ID=MMETSP0449_2-20121227/2503_1 /TAXON_ID=1082188 /ORGANISM="Strombidium rassoulzadegani, Strain ras09" /LENGTH=86 /DNA_ID=CAMNT_0008652175 /DNA_START=1373 /DNA_END=1629 /DNA_ORIENTATION=-
MLANFQELQDDAQTEMPDNEDDRVEHTMDEIEMNQLPDPLERGVELNPTSIIHSSRDSRSLSQVGEEKKQEMTMEEFKQMKRDQMR